MGLSITVGLPDEYRGIDRDSYDECRADFENLSAALAAEGVAWREPDPEDVPADSNSSAGFPYSFVTRLRRIYVRALADLPITPHPGYGSAQEREDEDRIIGEAMMCSSHLVCHADDEGYYIPVALDAPIFLPEEVGVAGAGMVGSSHGLLAELVRIAPALGIALDDQGGTTAVARAELRRMHAEEDPFEPEKYAWAGLYAACRASIASGQAIVLR